MCAAVFSAGLYPGKLYPDTAVNALNALNDNFGALFPAIIGATFQQIFRFDQSLTTIFLAQTLSYWLGVFLLCWGLLRLQLDRAWLAFAVLIAAISPYCLNYQFLLLKDNWLLNAYLIFFGLFSLTLTVQRGRVFLLLLMVVTACFLLLVRNGFLPLAIPLALCLVLTAWGQSVNRMTMGKGAAVLTSTAVLSFCLSFLADWTNETLSEGRRLDNNYRLDTFAAREQIALSMLTGHSGVSRTLSPTTQARLEHAYRTRWTWWRATVGDETKDLVNDLRESESVRDDWWEAVKREPLVYAKHRWNMFASHFSGSLRFNAKLLDRNVPFETERYQRLTEALRIEEIDNDLAWRAYTLYILGFFFVMPTLAWIPLLSLLMLGWSAVLQFRQGALTPSGTLLITMNLAAWSYMSPYILMLSHPEARYVYPALSLILFSIPVFAGQLLERTAMLERRGGVATGQAAAR
ncbi:MAG: hypothetical protein AAGH19_11720 [Pseudomonadota bacterium]